MNNPHLHIIDGVRGLGFESEHFVGQCLHGDLHANMGTKDGVNSESCSWRGCSHVQVV
jgi:hypothetical protein